MTDWTQEPLQPDTLLDGFALRHGASLSGWYAEPMTRAQAERLLETAKARQQAAYHQGESAFHAQLQELIARFWMERPIAAGFASLQAATPDAANLALSELVYGQLLASRKLCGALQHLENGFDLASDLLPPAGYFALLRRHEQLAWLPCGEQATPAFGLADLLTEAAVIRQLEGRRNTPMLHSQLDTLG